jgi:iron complex transport system substrate-binding protein
MEGARWMNLGKLLRFLSVVSLLATLTFALVLTSACTGGLNTDDRNSVGGAASSSGQITVTDMTGREIVLNGPATRIVALSPSDCEIIYALGAGESIVGRGTYCDYPEGVLGIPDVESGADMNVEQILALNPQVVLITKMDQGGQSQIAALENAGIKIVICDIKNIDETYTAIHIIGTITGKDAEANAMVDGMKQSFADIQSKVEAHKATKPPEPTPEKIYFEVSPLQYNLWASGSNTFMDEIATMLGLDNVFADVNGWAEISEEQVIERNPDYIVTVTMFYGSGVSPEEEISGRSGWGNIAAVKNGKVFRINNDEIARPGPRLVNAAEDLMGYIYPDLVD